jgi:hypothetical protein
MSSVYTFIEDDEDSITCDNCGDVVHSYWTNDFHTICMNHEEEKDE